MGVTLIYAPEMAPALTPTPFFSVSPSSARTTASQDPLLLRTLRSHLRLLGRHRWLWPRLLPADRTGSPRMGGPWPALSQPLCHRAARPGSPLPSGTEPLPVLPTPALSSSPVKCESVNPTLSLKTLTLNVPVPLPGKSLGTLCAPRLANT